MSEGIEKYSVAHQYVIVGIAILNLFKQITPQNYTKFMAARIAALSKQIGFVTELPINELYPYGQRVAQMVSSAMGALNLSQDSQVHGGERSSGSQNCDGGGGGRSSGGQNCDGGGGDRNSGDQEISASERGGGEIELPICFQENEIKLENQIMNTIRKKNWKKEIEVSYAIFQAHEEDVRNQSIIPQILTSMPTLDEATSYFAETTSLLTRCFTDFSVEHSSRDSGNPATHARELATFSNNGYRTINRSQSTFSDPSTSAADSPPVRDEMIRKSSEGPSQNSTAIVPSTGQTGISLFQGLIDRARRTVRGSADDIGWMQRDPEMPPVEDGTERFMGILDNIRHGLHKLPNSMVYLLVPGLFSNHGPLYFMTAKAYFSKLGLACHIAKIHSEASVEKNAREIKEYIEEICWGSQKRVMLLGHSKGGIDAAAAVSLYWPELKDKVVGLALAQSPYGGSPIASDILRDGQLGDYVNVRKLMEIIICKVLKGDLQALEDLTYEKRKEFLAKHHLPRELPVVSLRTETATSAAVLATLSRVAHAEVPMVGEPAKLPVIMPLGAAMAACAQLLQVRYGEKSDGLVTCCDAEVPGSVVVRPTRKLDHAWMVYSSLNDDPSEADASQVCEALLTLVLEEGQRKKYQVSMKNE
ncbi:alpha/beta-Hydrolases superfamily protein [Euphorbia peplus]|nr:alpha/beta-Hydrolases superfamily protein [Euphorbia peplus]